MDIRITTLLVIGGITFAIILAWLPPVSLLLILPLLFIFRRWPLVPHLSWFIVGFLYCVFRANVQLADTLPADLEVRWMVVTGTIITLPEQKTYGSRFLFQLEQDINLNENVLEQGSVLRLSWQQPIKPIKPQQVWQLQVRLKRPHGYANPGGIDYEYALFRKAISATGYVKDGGRNVLQMDKKHWSIDILRDQLRDKITRSLPQHTLYPLIVALVIGDRSLITSEQWQVLQNTGTAHLMAISGLHIGLLYGLGFVAMSFLCRHFVLSKDNTIAMLFGLVAAVFYAALAGFAIPTQRALIMLLCVVVMQFSRRYNTYSKMFAVAVLLVLLFDPLALFSAGFWLSFMAVAIIIACSVYRPGPKPWYWQWTRAQWFISCLSFPLLWFLFTSQSSTGLAANLIAIPIMSFIIVPLILLGVIVLVFSTSMADCILQFSHQLLGILWQYLQWLNTWSAFQLPLPTASLFTLTLCLVGLLWVFAPRGIPAKAIALILCVPFLFRAAERPQDNDFWLTTLDVGQGLAIVIQTQHHQLLYDTGARFGPDYDLGAAVILPYLRSQNIHHLDTVIVSHTDNDHIGGLDSIINNIPLQQLMISSSQALAYTYQPCVAQSWVWDGVLFEILHPEDLTDIGNMSKNDQSCVLRIANQHHSVLLTGDISRQIERQLVGRYGQSLMSDVVIVPHHGSQTSSSPGFIAQVSPQWAIVSCGYRNRFGFPKQAIIERYQRHQAKILNTAESGAIRLISHDSELKVERYRDSYRRLWHAVYDNNEFGET